MRNLRHFFVCMVLIFSMVAWPQPAVAQTGFLVSYDANGGTGAPLPEICDPGQPFYLGVEQPICEGCVFKGWSTSPSGDVEYLPGALLEPDADLILYAVWYESCFTCDGAGFRTQNVKCDSCNGKGTVTVSNEADCAYCTDGTVMITTTTKCTRCWGNIGIIVPDCYLCGGDGLFESTSGKTCSVCDGKGYTGGQFQSGCVPCGGEGVVEKTVSCSSCDGSGHLDQVWIVSYDANGGDSAPVSQIKRAGTALTLNYQRPTRKQFVFTGWALSADADAAYQPEDQYVSNERLVLYAVWQPAQAYEIRYDANGGFFISTNDPVMTQTKYQEEFYDTSDHEYPERSGYRFMGWSEISCGEGQYRFQCTEDRDYLLYAVWQPLCTQCDGSGCYLCDEGVLPLDYHTYDAGIEQTAPTCVSSGTRLYTCKLCSETKSEYIPPLEHDWGEWVVQKDAACNVPGIKTKSCIRCKESTSEYIPQLSHKYSEGNVVDPTCTTGGYTWYQCIYCGSMPTDSYTQPLGHSYGEWEVLKKPTCTQAGERQHSCIRCNEKETEYPEAIGHTPSNWITDIPAGCITAGEAHVECTVCGELLDTASVPEHGHNLTDWIIDLYPTCTEAGSQYRKCTVCEVTLYTEEIPQSGHEESDWIIDELPTCTQAGRKHTQCQICGEIVRSRSISETPHSYEWSVVAPTCTEWGYEVGICSVCGWHRYKNEVAALEHDWKENTCIRCGLTRSSPAPMNPFKDVKKGAFYYDPVLWAVSNGVTAGVSDTKFAPEQTCTRGQVVTFLWRAMGEPKAENSTNPFKDVKKGAFYYEAVLWAVENGITSGTSEKTFSPDDPCTRGQVVTFLWRTMGKPAVKSSSNPFKDVKKDAFYYDAVLWAVEASVTSGTSKTTFSPSDPCTRGQVVTFLYRTLN